MPNTTLSPSPNPTRAHKAPIKAHLVSCTLLLCEGGELESSETVPSSSSTMIEASAPEVCLPPLGSASATPRDRRLWVAPEAAK